MRIGVGVEGPSDREFWNKVLHRQFRGLKFDVRNMKTREKLIRATPQLLATFRDLHYRAGFIIVDMDDDPCVTAILDLFNETVRRIAREEKAQRFLHICVAKKNFESWLLADVEAIKGAIPGCSYDPPSDTSLLGKGKVRNLIKEVFGRNASFNEIAFAKSMSDKFSPRRALPHSPSFKYFWNLMEAKTTN